MSTYEEINKFLSQFKTDSYNREQIGNNKQLILKIYEYVTKFKVYKRQAETIINNIAYLRKDSVNIPIYLELLSKSIGYLDTYKLKDVITVVKQIHDIYNPNATRIELDEYIHSTDEEKTRKLFLTLNNKYLNRTFTNEDVLPHVNNLKFALAVELSNKEYQDFINYIDNFETFQNTYSPLMMYKTYLRVRGSLNDLTKLFWDLFFGNEYMVALVKHSISVKDIHGKPFTTKSTKQNKVHNHEQLQLELSDNLDKFQISTIYDSTLLTDYETERDMLDYYETNNYIFTHGFIPIAHNIDLEYVTDIIDNSSDVSSCRGSTDIVQSGRESRNDLCLV